MFIYTCSLKDCNKGFTLIEALLAMIILSIALLGMVWLQASIMGYNQYAGQVTAATTLAQDRIEEIKNATYTSISGGTITESNIDEGGNPGGIFDRQTVIDDTSLSNMKTITVTVSWLWRNKPRSVSLNTIISSSGAFGTDEGGISGSG
ncbi:MAG: prepilin-type N-terminal cleavage/methylation domain-containing protein [Deltaproteobacteria bacterium]|nr:prepilin-type N-terminal cleavage/methylation domain-containing protein [Deltaproteobacteria bacterium]MBW1996092.1 prepilin-type N-terminal cleavage/methylation domain-containing protein [Deltaproteobacteria bacterium]MBW2153170.1 prepilin-type N-terminal cleavage/methylation domain-containing protein [Deltaproteobacteria bacterium]